MDNERAINLVLFELLGQANDLRRVIKQQEKKAVDTSRPITKQSSEYYEALGGLAAIGAMEQIIYEALTGKSFESAGDFYTAIGELRAGGDDGFQIPTGVTKQ